LIGKKIKVEQVRDAVYWAKDAGIKHIEGNFIIGSDPSETMEDFEMTRKLVMSLPWTFVSITVIVPYPGTPIYNSMKAKNQIHVFDWDDYVMFGRIPKWETDNFSPQKLLSLQKKLSREFYLNPKYIAKQLMSIRSWSDANYWFSAGTAFLRYYFTGKI
jgi:radical SAM superfamily enzyme YgiQ (UPF0313 family)